MANKKHIISYGNYHPNKGITLVLGLFGIFFFCYALLYPESVTIRNDEGNIMIINFFNILPILIVSMVLLAIYSWLSYRFFRVKMNEDGIQLLSIWTKKEFNWSDFNSITDTSENKLGRKFEAKPKKWHKFYFRSDKADSTNFLEIFDGSPQCEMQRILQSKISEIGKNISQSS